MKRLLSGVFLCFLILSVVLPTPIFAQDDPVLLWTLAQVVDIEVLNVRLNVPRGWTVEQTTDDTTAGTVSLLVSEPETAGAGYVISLSTFQIGITNPSEILERSGMIIADPERDITADRAVNIRPAVTVTGTGDGGQALFTFWEAGGLLIACTLDVPGETVTPDEAYSWQQLLATVRPLVFDDIVFATAPYEFPDLNAAIAYPDGWTPAISARDAGTVLGFYQQAADVDSQAAPNGAVMAVFRTDPIHALDQTKMAALIESFQGAAVDLDSAQIDGTFSVVGQTGSGFTVIDSSGRHGYYIFALDQEVFESAGESGSVAVWSLTAPDQETFEAAVPVFLSVLWRVEILDGESSP
ncbi:MAG: hypothetical protein JXQ72_02655 [Anaerolineae bacterium]|nr:hypothetical protein [Anaerolineae bacterium]